MLREPYICVFKHISEQINLTQVAEMFSGRCLVNLIITFRRCIYFCINIIIFRHLEQEIALAIPAPNEGKIVLSKFGSIKVKCPLTVNPLGQGLCKI